MIAADASQIIRPLTTIEELRAAEQIQRDVWRIPDLEVVPLYQLAAARHSGGVLLGAFDGDQLAGFVYGFVGLENGEFVHHSHMLAVREGYRSKKLGWRLKLEQRRIVMDQGIEKMTWTFDPLRSLNAAFNFGRLGVIADQYLVDFYGNEAASFLHRNGTDRFWVTWRLSSPEVVAKIEGRAPEPDIRTLPVLITVCETNAPIIRNPNAVLRSSKFIIEIPGNIGEIEGSEPELAANWRRATREAFQSALGSGFVVVDFVRSERVGQTIGSYVLSNAKVGRE